MSKIYKKYETQMVPHKLYFFFGYLLFFFYFLLFPFGQLLRIEGTFFNTYVVIHPVDVVALLSLPYLFVVRKNIILKLLGKVVFIFALSLIFSLTIFPISELKTGALYLTRLISYFSFSLLIYHLAINKIQKRIMLLTVFLSISLFMLFGIYQIVYYYDLRDLFYSGWDDHLYRLSSTLLDPGYSVLVLITGLIILLKSKLVESKFLKIVLILLFAVSIVLTFSRAGYITAVIVLFYIYKKYYKAVLISAIIFLAVLFILPKPRSSGVELYRTFSIYSRINNYKNTFKIFTRYPVFGIGYNNICNYRLTVLNVDNISSHSCSGSDSSLLLILASTGILGMATFLNAIFKIGKNLKNNVYDKFLMTVFLAVIINSFFNNSLFYNFMMGLVAVFVGLTRKNVIPGKKV